MAKRLGNENMPLSMNDQLPVIEEVPAMSRGNNLGMASSLKKLA